MAWQCSGPPKEVTGDACLGNIFRALLREMEILSCVIACIVALLREIEIFFVRECVHLGMIVSRERFLKSS